jgi:chromosome condensin MukBEF complex kleisin-like MukF subunit
MIKTGARAPECNQKEIIKMKMVAPQERQKLTEQIREVLKKDGLKAAIKIVKKLLAEVTGPLKEWLDGILYYLKKIEDELEDKLKELYEAEEKRIAEELEEEARIAMLWVQLAMGAWGCADVTWAGVALKVIQTIRPDQEGPAPR